MNGKKLLFQFAALSVSSVLFLSTALGRAAASEENSLVFDPAHFTTNAVSAGGRTIHFRAYENIVYVSKPVNIDNQKINIYIPEDFFHGKSIGGCTAETAPIFFPNAIGGYSPAVPASLGDGRAGRSLMALALAKGMVVASPGARGSSSQDKNGDFSGKAPACIVDLKAAVRYLRHNDKIMPGDAEKIISNGTSAGGACSALLGATGNSPDYEPYLKAIGAAVERDDIFAASCYCPITDLDHADMAYEWLFHGINETSGRGGAKPMTEAQVNYSAELKALFPTYVNSLSLTSANGTALTLAPNGEGSFKDHVKSFVIASAQKAFSEGKNLSHLPWLVIKDAKIIDLDFGKYAAYATRMKGTPAFDSLSLGTPENNLFGDAKTNRKHFTQFAMEHGAGHVLADPDPVKQMNPMHYIGVKGISVAKHWRIRHGAVDRDTSIAIPVMLATRLQNSGSTVDLELPWGVGHSGDYDPDEFFVWIDHICH